MELSLSHSISGRRTEYPAAVISNVIVRAPDGHVHRRRWEAVIQTGADMSILPVEIAADLRLTPMPHRIRVWTYSKEEQPRDLELFYVKLGLPSNMEVLTFAVLSQRNNILVGRSALMKTRLPIDWPANRWRLENSSFPSSSA